MKKISLLLVVLSVLVFSGCNKNDVVSPADQMEAATLKSATVNGKYIVVLKEDAAISSTVVAQSRIEQVKAKAYGLLKKNDITESVEEVYGTALQGFAVKMAPGQAKKLASDEHVKYIEPDQVVALSPIEMKAKPSGGTTQPAQTIPWGITRVKGGVTYTGTNVAWIIDTGVDLTHPDLNVGSGVSFVPRVTSPNDDNGHGSHVAGIIAAKNNTIGVIGVAGGAKVIPVKVLDKRGSGAYSVIIAGVDYVAANGKAGDVANMSLGGPPYQALDDAVFNASDKGIYFSLAAGNESTDANNSSPARVNGNNIYTVSAMDNSDIFAYFSNYGNPPVDYCEPGLNILSCYKGGGYATMSGTSMAAPHMAGLLLLGAVNSGGTVTGDPDGNPDKIGVH
jgi:subtilisin family serine protease